MNGRFKCTYRSCLLLQVIYDKLTGRSRGFGFVTMSSKEEVEAACQQFNGYVKPFALLCFSVNYALMCMSKYLVLNSCGLGYLMYFLKSNCLCSVYSFLNDLTENQYFFLIVKFWQGFALQSSSYNLVMK